MPLKINNEIIKDDVIFHEMNQMRSDYQRMFASQSKREQEEQLLDWAKENIIERILLQHEAEKKDFEIDENAIEDQLQSVKKSWDNEADFLEALKKEDKSIDDLKKDIKLQLKSQKLVENIQNNVVTVTEEDARDYYRSDQGKYKVPEQIHAKHIVIHIDQQTTPEKAMETIMSAKVQIDMGKDFEEVGNQYSHCPSSGLDLGYFTRGQMVQNFENVVFKMKVGEISDVFQTEFGYHIAKVYDRKDETQLSFSQVKDDIIKNLNKERKEQAVIKFVDNLKKDVKIEFTKPKLKVEKTNKPLSFLLVKPAGPDCNMACDYCFYLEKKDYFNETVKHRMNDKTLEAMIKQLGESSSQQISLGFQGGEPTLMGLEYYKKAIQYQKQYCKGKQIGNSIQTNGILIDEKWAEFLKKNQFLVGLSIDGPQHIHDHYRKLSGGQPSWQKVNDVAKMLMKKGVAVNSLSVVNSLSANHIEDTYTYLKSLGFSFMQFIPAVETDKDNPAKSADFSVTSEQYGDFLCKLFDLWKKDIKNGRPTISIRLFDALFHKYVGMTPPECTLQAECGTYMVVEHNGDVFSCDFFVEPEWKLGNVNKDNLTELLNSDKQDTFGKIKSELPKECEECEWLHLCRGGCPKDRIRDPRDNNITHFCQSYKKLFEHSDKYFKKLAEKYLAEMNQQQPEQAKPRYEPPVEPLVANNIGRNDPCPCGSGKKYKKCCGKD